MNRYGWGSGRALATLAVTATLAVGTAAAAVSPATSAPARTGAQSGASIVNDCVPAYPTADLTAGQEVNGLTVVQGTTPTSFTGEVLGVLHDGIAPGIDMIMVDLDMPEFARTGGVWQGMSGSPVYADDGRLIGAVSYGLSFGPSPIAGVTPFEAMDDYLSPALGRVAVGAKTAQAIAAETDVTAAQASGGFAQLRMPLGVSGVGAKRLADTKGRSWLPKTTYAAGSSSGTGTGPGVETIVAGGNLAAAVSYGDITMGGVGTATSVCDDRVVGFGHPLNFLGHTTEMLMPADSIYIQPDSTMSPFKVANFGDPVGTLTDDRSTGITGTLGTLPDTLDITSKLTYGASSRTGSTHVSVPEAAASAVLYQLLANHDRVIDGVISGSELQTWRIAGHSPAGPWALNLTDRYLSDNDITGEVPWDVADQVYLLSSLAGVTVDSVSVTGTVSDDDSAYSMGKVEQYRAGTWHQVTQSAPVTGRAGQNLNLRVTLKSPTGTKTVAVKIAVPAGAAGARGRLALSGGGSQYGYDDYYIIDGRASGSALANTLRSLRSSVRNDEIQINLQLVGKRHYFSKRAMAGPADKVVQGHRILPVRIG